MKDVLSATLICLAIALPLEAVDPEQATHTWQAMQTWSFGSAQPVPDGGLVLRRDVATFTMTSGTVSLMAPADGAIHGLVFEGTGVMRIEVPNADELYQLRRFTEDPSLDALEAPFSKLFIRTSDDLGALTGLTSSGGSSNDIARDRHEHWFIEEWLDADARIVTAALNGGAIWERVDVETPEWDWVSFLYDSSTDEEVSVSQYSDGFTESWLSMQRAEDRGKTSEWRGEIDIEHFGIRGDLTKKGSGRAVGAKSERPTDALMTIDVRFKSLFDDLRAIEFSLHPEAKDVVVKSESGEPLQVIRDHIGARTIRIDKKYSDPIVTVVLDTPMKRGETRTLRFDYTLEIPTFAIGDSWYPTKLDDWNDLYTASMEFTVPKKHELKSMGKLIGEGSAGGNTTSTWEVSRPTVMLTFCIASRFDEKTVEIDEVPPVHSFGPSVGFGGRNKIRNVGIDVANSLRFFSWLLDTPLTEDDFYVTAIPSGHGQAFDGFLHLSEGTFQADSAGASELFRAHEVAHQWWGHRLRWASYRDQWISEAFAEYSAMMFVETTVKGGDKFFEEILEVYDSILKGSISGGFSRFNRPWLIALNPEHRDRVGPISHGRRASTKEIPGGYQIQAYVRGPMVIHMLRKILRADTGSEDTFIAILRDFVKDYSGTPVSTDDFKNVVEKRAGRDFDWFFDQWVHRSEIPHVEWSYSTTTDSDGAVLNVHMERKGEEGDGFVLPVPIHLELAGGRSGTLMLVLDEREKDFEQRLPSAPKKVVLNPGYAVLMTSDKK